ncbi:MAG: metal-dependent transcriptional regulator [Candidatus Dadabacteria bacterium]|nr:metal-dependent transcriptional regulator [Candidatus Dadabacteria bacterium]
MATKRTEDYLEAINTVVRRKGYAKVSDISKILAVGPPSVTEMFKKLSDEGYVNYERYSGVTLTPKGRKIAEETRTKHNTIKEFLLILGIEEAIADEDACKIEHTVNPETMSRLTNFVSFVKKKDDNPRWLDHFRYFHETGRYVECRPSTAKDCPVHRNKAGVK